MAIKFHCVSRDALTNVFYHNLCWAAVKKKGEIPRNTVYTNKEIIHTVSEIELIYLIESELNDPSHKVNITYHNLIFENGLSINDICENYKKQLKILIQENIPCTKFVKSKCSNHPENILQKERKEKQYINHQYTKHKISTYVL